MFVSVHVITSLVSLESESRYISKVTIYLPYTMFASAVLRAITTGDTKKRYILLTNLIINFQCFFLIIKVHYNWFVCSSPSSRFIFEMLHLRNLFGLCLMARQNLIRGFR
jgi:hypothetical protein